MKVTKWKIWYDDGSTFSSQDGEAKEAPLDGVQVIVEWYDNNNIKVIEGQEYYWWTGDCWAFGRIQDLERWLRALFPELKFGRFTKNAVHLKAIKEAHGSR